MKISGNSVQVFWESSGFTEPVMNYQCVRAENAHPDFPGMWIFVFEKQPGRKLFGIPLGSRYVFHDAIPASDVTWINDLQKPEITLTVEDF